LSIDTEHQIIVQMPKIELHLHLEGAFTFEFLFYLIDKYGGDHEINGPDDIAKKFKFRNFEHFLELWFWKNRFFREADDFEKCAYTTLEKLASQNVLYCEVFFSPWDFTNGELSVEEITEAILHGVRRAENDYPITCNLIADLVRDYDANEGVNRVRQMMPYIDKGVVGIGLGGSEQKYPAKYFKEAFKMAGDMGFHLTAHAGEAAGPESIWEVIRKLKVERIGHGVRAIEDPELIKYLRDNQVPLEVCIVSNLKTKIFPSPESHPIKELIKNRLNITINSDDPAMFGATITDEFINLYDQFDISFTEIRQLTTNAISSAFISDEKKEILKQESKLFWIEKMG